MRAWVGYGVACLLAAAAPLVRGGAAPRALAPSAFPGWPAVFEGRPLQALTLTAREERFAEGFPGRIARFTDGQREVILRWVAEPTRQLHPAEDCFRGSGYRVSPVPRTSLDGAGWHRFAAERDGVTLHVREHIAGPAAGQRWTDMSSWYWSALLGRSHGPWWAVTVAERRAAGDAPPR